jgi:hypothetical protein
MRFKSRYSLKEQEGQTRIVRKFLFLPRHFGEDKEWRWLEYADIIEQVYPVDVGGSMIYKYDWVWIEMGFADKK